GASEELYRSTGQVECRSDRTQCGLGRPTGVGGLDHTDHEQAVEVSAHCCFRSARAYIDLEPHRFSLPGGSLNVRVTDGRRDHTTEPSCQTWTAWQKSSRDNSVHRTEGSHVCGARIGSDV